MIEDNNIGRWDKIFHEKMITDGRVIVLNTIPLGRDRFESERPEATKSWFRPYRRICDFLHQIDRPGFTWNDYEDLVAVPVITQLLEIRENTAATIDYDVSFDTFIRVLQSQMYDVIFLCAHHGKMGIEFADGMHSFSQIEASVRQLPSGSGKVSLMLIVCNADPLARLQTEMPEKIKSVATAYWNMPVLGSYLFIKNWVLHLSPFNTLSGAYSQAIKVMTGA